MNRLNKWLVRWHDAFLTSFIVMVSFEFEETWELSSWWLFWVLMMGVVVIKVGPGLYRHLRR